MTVISVDELISRIVSISVALSPIVMIIAEAIKHMEVMPRKYTPIISVSIGGTLGSLLGWFFPETTKYFAEMVLSGIVAGGLATGLYDITTKGAKEEIKELEEEIKELEEIEEKSEDE